MRKLVIAIRKNYGAYSTGGFNVVTIEQGRVFLCLEEAIVKSSKKTLLYLLEPTGKTIKAAKEAFFVLQPEVLSGKVIALTGADDYNISREVWKQIIVGCGGEYNRKVTRQTSFLVMSEKLAHDENLFSTKRWAAEKLGVPCVTYFDFYKMFESS